MTAAQRMLSTLKQRQTRRLIDGFGIRVARYAEQSRDLALSAWAMANAERSPETARDLIIEISQQVSETTNLCTKLKEKFAA